MVIFGTRPEAIKMAPVIQELSREESIELKVCVTAQHRELLDQVLRFFYIQPDFDLNLMKPNQDLTDITTNVILGLRDVFKIWKPDWIIVHGDTTTTLAASIAGFYEKIKVAHVEAGLRTGDILTPWPEEANRKLTSVVSSLHFAPTNEARANLLNEGVESGKILVTGNTVIDALLKTVAFISSDVSTKYRLANAFPFIEDRLHLVLVTGHRRENFGERFISICESLKEISNRGDVQIVYPLHPNPNILVPARQILGTCSNVHLIDPQEYVDFVYLMSKAKIILTDSGGIQEEAPSLGKPVLVMRDETERPEAVAAGTVKLVGTSKTVIVNEISRLLDNESEYKRMTIIHNPYGDGLASTRIVNELKMHF